MSNQFISEWDLHRLRMGDQPTLFLGYPISTWMHILHLAKERDITVDELAKRFEGLECDEWRNHFGVLAEIAELK